MAQPKTKLKSARKISKLQAIIGAGLLAVVGIVVVLLAHAGGGDGTVTIPLDAVVKSDGFEKFTTTQQSSGNSYDVCFNLRNTQSEIGPNPKVRIQATRGNSFVSKEQTLDQTYYQSKDLCIDTPVPATSSADNGIRLGVTVLAGGNLAVNNYCLAVHGQQAGGCEDLNWLLNPSPIRGFAGYAPGSFQEGDTVRVCFDVTPAIPDPGSSSGVNVQISAGTKAQPDTALVDTTVLTERKTLCAKPLVTTNASNQIEYAASVKGVGTFTVNSMLLDKFDVTPPTAPTKLRVLGETRTTVTLRWVASYDPNNGPVANYLVYRNGVSLGFAKNLTFTDPKGIPTYTWTDHKLRPGTRYRYVIQAVDTVGNRSPKSAPVAVITKP